MECNEACDLHCKAETLARAYALKGVVTFSLVSPLLLVGLHFYATVFTGKDYPLNQEIMAVCLGSVGAIIYFFFKKNGRR